MIEHIDPPAPVDPTTPAGADPDLVDEATRHVDNPAWARTATASKVPAMLGFSPYDSQKSLWLKMRHPERFPRKGNASTRRGSMLESAHLAMWFDANPRFERLTDTEVTFEQDYWPFLAAATPDSYARDTETGDIIGVETKTVGPYATSLKQWGAPGSDVIPMKYLVQAVWQNMCGKFARTAVIKNGPLIDDQDTYWVDRNDGVEQSVFDRVAEFMQTLADDLEPDNDTRAETYDAMRLTYWEILADDDPNALWEIHPGIALEFIEALHDIDRAEGRLTLAKCDLITVMGNARKAVVPGPERISEKTGKPLKSHPLVIATRKALAGGASIVKPRTMPDLDYLRALAAAATEQQGAA